MEKEAGNGKVLETETNKAFLRRAGPQGSQDFRGNDGIPIKDQLQNELVDRQDRASGREQPCCIFATTGITAVPVTNIVPPVGPCGML